MKEQHTKSSVKKIKEREKKERELEFKKLYPNKKPYPNATIGEIRKNAKKIVSLFAYVPGHPKISKKYQKGNFMYLIHGYDITAFYIPSQKKKLKIMFEWNSKKRKWVIGLWREGHW